MSRTLIVANRLPLTVKRTGGEWTLQPSAGGLAAGLKSIHDPSRDLWVGWPGIVEERLPAGDDFTTDAWLRRGCVPVSLSRADVRGYYQRYSNAVVWPLLHSLVGRLPLRPGPWPVYEQVNRRFAEAVLTHYRMGDLIWIHDYQLMRVPALVRNRLPDARVGFFLHVPFPPAEIFAVLPEREAVLEGLLGADLVGFHTEEYRANFAAAVQRLLGIVPDGGRLHYRGRVVELGVFPLGIDFQRFSHRSQQPAIAALSEDFAARPGNQLLVGVDRLDYTKGIPRRLLAFERLLELHPEFRGRVHLVQLGVPSRTNVPAYRKFRQQIDALVGRINGSFGTPSWAPVHYLVRTLAQDDLIALYRATDVMVVTPVRDGMNLVAKEFAASRIDEDGVLVLSEFAGAAAELREALQVNPYDIDGTARALHRALTMAPEERRARMRALRQRVAAADAHQWAASFVSRLRGARTTAAEGPEPGGAGPDAAAEVIRQVGIEQSRRATRTLLLLDYDGTLVPFAPTPQLAAPDPGVLALLEALAARPRTELHLVSGRDRGTLEAWFGHLPVGLHAEHGLWSRDRRDGGWVRVVPDDLPHRGDILELLEEFAGQVPGSLIEEKSAALVWHYRLAEPGLAARETRRLRATLARRLAGAPVDLLPGNHVLEVRLRGVDKGGVARRLVSGLPTGGVVIAMGDDRTDEELFAVLPPDALTIHVGRSPTRARLRVDSVEEARTLLWALVAAAEPADDLIVDLIRRVSLFFIAAGCAAAVGTWLPLSDVVRRLIGATFIVAAVYQAGLWGNGLILALLERRAQATGGSTATTLAALGFLARLALWSALVLLALQNLGVNVTALVTGLGIGGIAVALAVQNILGDLLASVAIVLDRPFELGDFIIIDDVMGTVEHIGLKTTRIRSLFGEQIVVANGLLLGSRIRNYKRMNERRVVFSLGVTYETPPRLVAAIPGMIREIVQHQAGVRFDRAHFQKYGDFALLFEVVYYTLSPDYNRYMDVQQAINLDILERFEREGIEFAYPTQSLKITGLSPVAGRS